MESRQSWGAKTRDPCKERLIGWTSRTRGGHVFAHSYRSLESLFENNILDIPDVCQRLVNSSTVGDKNNRFANQMTLSLAAMI